MSRWGARQSILILDKHSVYIKWYTKDKNIHVGDRLIIISGKDMNSVDTLVIIYPICTPD